MGETIIILSHGRNVFTAVESMAEQLVKIQSELGRNHETSFSILMLSKKVHKSNVHLKIKTWQIKTSIKFLICFIKLYISWELLLTSQRWRWELNNPPFQPLHCTPSLQRRAGLEVIRGILLLQLQFLPHLSCQQVNLWSSSKSLNSTEAWQERRCRGSQCMGGMVTPADVTWSRPWPVWRAPDTAWCSALAWLPPMPCFRPSPLVTTWWLGYLFMEEFSILSGWQP